VKKIKSIDGVENLEDGCEITMRGLVRHEEFMLRIGASDGINSINVDLYSKDAENMYNQILKRLVVESNL